jgi:hypothetical protein
VSPPLACLLTASGTHGPRRAATSNESRRHLHDLEHEVPGHTGCFHEAPIGRPTETVRAPCSARRRTTKVPSATDATPDVSIQGDARCVRPRRQRMCVPDADVTTWCLLPGVGAEAPSPDCRRGAAKKRLLVISTTVHDTSQTSRSREFMSRAPPPANRQ